MEQRYLIGAATLIYIIGNDIIREDFQPIRDIIKKSLILRRIVIFSLFLAMTKSISISFALFLLFSIMPVKTKETETETD